MAGGLANDSSPGQTALHTSPPASDAHHPRPELPRLFVSSSTDDTLYPLTDSPKDMRDTSSISSLQQQGNRLDSAANSGPPSRCLSPTSSESSNESTTALDHEDPGWEHGPVASPHPDRVSDHEQLPEEEKPYSLRPFSPDDVEPDPSAPANCVPYISMSRSYELRLSNVSNREKPPPGWIRLTHPAGQPYFWHEKHRAATWEWMPDPQIAKCINEVLLYIVHRLETWSGPPYTSGRQIVIGVEALEVNLPVPYAACYYIVEPARQSIFWLDDDHIAYYLQDAQAKLEPQTKSIWLRYQFYKNWDHFPNLQQVTPELIYQWQEMLDYALADVMFSKTATINYSAHELREMIDMVNRMHCESGFWVARYRRKQKNDPVSGCEWLPGRMIQHFYRDRFFNLYGQRGARLDRQQSVFGNCAYKRTWFIKIVGVLLFMDPWNHLLALNRMWVDQVLSRKPWLELTERLLAQWSDQRVVATILLTANMSFLSVNDLDSSISKILCFLSALSSSGSFVLITVLDGRIRRIERRVDLQGAQDWLNMLNNKRVGLEILAVLLGLPYGLTIWSIIFFIASFMSYCMSDVKSPTAITVGGFFGLLFLIVIWAIWLSTENRRTVQEHGKMPKVVFKGAARAGRRVGRALTYPIRKMSTKLQVSLGRSYTLNTNGVSPNHYVRPLTNVTMSRKLKHKMPI
ncbi:hypothetical protein EV715DRAFT_203152 [Schizophyllum commune]